MVSRIKDSLGKFAPDPSSDHFKAKDKKLLAVWRSIKHRCLSPKSTCYDRYGGRGISICEKWLSYSEFELWAFENGYGEGLTIDRIDFNGHYSPENCRWVDMAAQARNTRRSVLITAFGETKNLIDWAQDSRCSVDRETISFRMRKGESAESAITRPRSGKYYEGFGESKTSRKWHEDPRCRTPRRALDEALLGGASIEQIFCYPSES
jgi:hypothetical protein